MPLKLNVGLNRKVGEANFSSRGASVNLDIEVDPTLAAEPGRLQERIRELFDLARQSIDEELRAVSSPASAPPTNAPRGSGPMSATNSIRSSFTTSRGHANAMAPRECSPTTESTCKPTPSPPTTVSL